MLITEDPFWFECEGEQLVAIIHKPKQASRRGVMIIVGGPQYRVGSHRQFILLARALAKAGISVMRFDYRGMGDSQGSRRTFYQIEKDIKIAIDEFFKHEQTLKELVILGLCDAVSASLLYAYKDPRITGLVLLNPWIRTEESMVKTYIKHYYLARLLDRATWKGIANGQYNLVAAVTSFLNMFSKMLLNWNSGKQLNKQSNEYNEKTQNSNMALPEKMYDGLKRFTGHTLFILSGNDLTAAEFKDLVKGSPKWQSLLENANTTKHELLEANHTFSKREWRDQVATWTIKWIKTW